MPQTTATASTTATTKAPLASARRDSRLAAIAAAGGIAATVVTGLACVGPLVAIVLGIGGMGFLVKYAYLRVPATILTFALLGLGFYLAYRRPSADSCAKRSACKRRASRAVLWVGAVLAVGINVFEYVVFPYLA